MGILDLNVVSEPDQDDRPRRILVAAIRNSGGRITVPKKLLLAADKVVTVEDERDFIVLTVEGD